MSFATQGLDASRGRVSSMATHFALSKLVLLDDLALAIALSDVADTAEQDKLAKALLTVCAAAGEDIRLCRRMVDMEFERHPQTVLRAQSLASRVLSVHASVVGGAYLNQTLLAPMQVKVLGCG